jgi:hypothetical protein
LATSTAWPVKVGGTFDRVTISPESGCMMHAFEFVLPIAKLALIVFQIAYLARLIRRP